VVLKTDLTVKQKSISMLLKWWWCAYCTYKWHLDLAK
jgi:hypothetical protein